MNNTNDGWEKMGNDKKNSNIPAWNPAVEKEIFGIYVEKAVGVGPNNSNMYYLQLADGSKKGVWGSYVVDDRFQNIQPGYEVKIVSLGKRENPKTHRAFWDLEFFVRKPRPVQAAQTAAPAVEEEVNPDDIPF
jgi:hypothetical protein